MAMLRPRVLTQVLGQCNGNGVKNTMLFNREGILLAFSGYNDKDGRVTAAIAANVWSAYEKIVTDNQNSSASAGSLNLVFVDCEKGRIVITGVANLLVCFLAEPTVNLGMLQLKIKKLTNYLEDPLMKVAQNVNV